MDLPSRPSHGNGGGLMACTRAAALPHTDRASRDARKIMLECRETGAAACLMKIGGTMQACVAHKKQVNEYSLPCLSVLGVRVLARGVGTDGNRAEAKHYWQCVLIGDR